VTPLRKRLMHVVALAVMVVALTANVAAADDGGTNLDYVPYDPGLPAVPYDPGLLQVPYDPGLLNVPYDPGLLTVPYDPGLPAIQE
jgi:hypothetical protein